MRCFCPTKRAEREEAVSPRSVALVLNCLLWDVLDRVLIPEVARLDVGNRYGDTTSIRVASGASHLVQQADENLELVTD